MHAACDAVHLRSVGCAILPRLFSPASWLRDQRLLLSALQYKSRIAMRTWRRTLPKQMTILHALLRRGCSWKPHCLNNFETACSCLLLCFFVAWLSSSSYVMNASICLEHTHTHTLVHGLLAHAVPARRPPRKCFSITFTTPLFRAQPSHVRPSHVSSPSNMTSSNVQFSNNVLLAFSVGAACATTKTRHKRA